MKPARSIPPMSVGKSTTQSPTVEELRTFMPLVHRAVAGFVRKLPPSVQRDDLVAAGTYGLVDSLRRHKGDRGPQFEWYARIRIRGAIVDELRAQDWLTRRARGHANSSEVLATQAKASFIGIDDLPGGEGSLTGTEPAPNVLDILEQRSEREHLTKVVGELPERERYVIVAHYFEGVQFKAIAQVLGVSEPRISQLHTRACDLLRARLAAAKDSAA
jgi:RNA polymerase sigma factor for flagellar operon FliA